MFESPVRRSGSEALHWLIRQRWLAVAGQSAAVLTAVILFGLRFEPLPLAGGIMLLALSNHRLFPEFGDDSGRIGRILAFDVALLTWMLYWTGGRENPFVVCYLLNLALSAMLLQRRGMLAIGILSAAGYLLISLTSQPFTGTPPWVVDGRLAPGLKAFGTSFALVLVGGIMAVFLFAMRRELLADERALQQGKRRLAEMERFKSLATLAAGVAHELGTPLGTIAIAAKDLERSLGRGQQAEEALEDAELIRREVERCRLILKRLDRHSTSGTGNVYENFALGEIASRLAERLTPDHAGRLQTGCATPELEVCLPTQAVLQGLVVLVENACEADETGKPVELTIDCLHEQVRFRVCDRGPGLSAEARHRAGEPYFTTKPNEGSGLGLFLVRTLTLELGGEVKLEPIAEGGTCATLTLPDGRNHGRIDETHSSGR